MQIPKSFQIQRWTHAAPRKFFTVSNYEQTKRNHRNWNVDQDNVAIMKYEMGVNGTKCTFPSLKRPKRKFKFCSAKQNRAAL